MIPQAEKIIERAQSGEKVSAGERRHAVAYVMAGGAIGLEKTTNEELATLFSVSERQIRNDKKNIREEKAASITEDDISLVIADIYMTLERQMRDLERSKKACKVGSATYLRHCQVIHELQLKSVAALQELGYYPKNLGQMTVNKYDYVAVITPDGRLESRPANLLIEAPEEETPVIQEAEFEVITPVESEQIAMFTDNPGI